MAKPIDLGLVLDGEGAVDLIEMFREAKKIYGKLRL